MIGSDRYLATFVYFTSGLMREIEKDYISRGKYSTINRARQYGRTTLLHLLEKHLQKKDIPEENTDFFDTMKKAPSPVLSCHRKQCFQCAIRGSNPV